MVSSSLARHTLLPGGLAIALWGSLATLSRLAAGIPPFALLALTFAVAAALGGALAAVRGRWQLVWRQPSGAWLLGTGGLFGFHALYFLAMSRAPAAQVSLLCYLWPVLLVAIAAHRAGRRPGRRQGTGLVLAVAGAALAITGRDTGGFALQYLAGYAAAIGAALVWAVYSALQRRHRTVAPEAIAGHCAVTALLGALVHLGFEPVPAVAGTAALAALALGLGPVGIAFFAWDRATKHGDLVVLGTLSYIAPVLSLLLLVLAGQASASATLALATLLVVTGAGLAATDRPV
jgi:drug/metabolite transporter (DMT)-like permease